MRARPRNFRLSAKFMQNPPPMPDEVTLPPQPRNFWREVLPTLAWLVALMIGPYFVTLLLAGITLGIAGGVQGGTAADIAKEIARQLAPPELLFWLSGIFASILMIICAQWAAARRFGPESQSRLGLVQTPMPPRLFGLLLLLLVGYLGWAGVVVSMLKAVWPAQVIMPEIASDVARSGWTGPLAFVFVAFLVPIAEELVFRGYVLARFGTVMPAKHAVLAAAVLFGLAHFNGGLLHPLITVYLGVANGWLRVSRGSLVPCMILHCMVNSLAVATMLGR